MSDLETTQQLTRAEAAHYLRQFADQLDPRPPETLTSDSGASDVEPTTTPSTPTATDTSTRGRTQSNVDVASNHEANPGAGADAGAETDRDVEPDRNTGTDHHEEPDRSADTDRHAETDGGGDAVARTHESSGPGSVRDGRVTILVGNDSATVNPPSDVELAVAVGTDDSLVTSGAEQFVSFELTWDADAVDDEETLDIE